MFGIQKKEKVEKTKLQILGGMTVSLIGVGTVFYHLVEKFSLVDSFYFTIITLSTVGYGHLHPVTTIGKLFTAGYIIVGVGILGAFISEYVSYRLDKRK